MAQQSSIVKARELRYPIERCFVSDRSACNIPLLEAKSARPQVSCDRVVRDGYIKGA